MGWHAYEHFLQEKIQLRHIIDWALALSQLSELEANSLSDAKAHSRWGKFTDAMTVIALHRLGLPPSWFHAKELESAKAITQEQEKRVWDDVMHAPPTPHSWSNNIRRVNIAKRMLKNSWKYDAYADMSSKQYLWRNVIGHVKHIKFEH